MPAINKPVAPEVLEGAVVTGATVTSAAVRAAVAVSAAVIESANLVAKSLNDATPVSPVTSAAVTAFPPAIAGKPAGRPPALSAAVTFLLAAFNSATNFSGDNLTKAAAFVAAAEPDLTVIFALTFTVVFVACRCLRAAAVVAVSVVAVFIS